MPPFHLSFPTLKVWAVGIAAAIGSAGLLAAEEMPWISSAPPFVRYLLITLSILTALAVFANHVRKLINKSDEKTAATVNASQQAMSVDVAKAIQAEMRILRQENANREGSSVSVSSQLNQINRRLVEQGDVHGELQGMAFQMGEMNVRQSKMERDVNSLHAWKRELEPWRMKADALMAQWKEERKRSIERRALTSDDKDTPPAGGTPIPT